MEEEDDETVYFLQLLAVLNEEYKHLIQPLINDGTEILKIIVTPINSTRNRIANASAKQ